MVVRRESQASSAVQTSISESLGILNSVLGLTLCGGMERRLPLEGFMKCQAPCRVVLGTRGYFRRMHPVCQCPFVW